MEVALAISRGNLHTFISEVVSSGLGSSPVKIHLEERFSECGSATMAKQNLTQLKQSKLPMHEYIAKFGKCLSMHTALRSLTMQMPFWYQISSRVCKTPT